MQHTPFIMDRPLGREIELIHPGKLIFSGPAKKRPALETLLSKNGFRLEQVLERPDGTLPEPGHGLPSYSDPLTAGKAGAPNSGHTPGTSHPAELRFYIAPGDHKKTKACKARDCEHVGQTELRPNPLSEHIGKAYEPDPGITFVTCEWARLEQIHDGRFIAEGCGWTLRAVTHPSKVLIEDMPEDPQITALRKELDVIREMVGLPPRIAGAAANTPAWAMQSGSHSAQLARQANSAPFTSAGGILDTGGYQVTQNGTPNMTVNIAGGDPGGRILVPRTGTTFAGLYYGYNDATVNMTGFTAPSSNSWISTVFAQAEDAAYGDASTIFQLGFVTGSASSSPVAPSLAVSSYGLANITIASTTTSITTGLITNIASMAVPQLGVRSFNGRTGVVTPQNGDYVSSQVLSGTVTQPARSLGTAYQPSTTRFTFVNVNATVATGGGVAGISGVIGPTSSPATTIATNTAAQTTTFTTVLAIAFIVPPSWYYEASNLANVSSIAVTETAL